jgi:signal transduction histidine kinase
MTSSHSTDRLAALPLFEAVPREELEWLAERSEMRTHAAGELIGTADVPVEEMSIVLEGIVGLYVPAGGGWRRIMLVETGFVYGCAPYSRIKTLPGRVVVEEDTTLQVLHRKYLPDLIRECATVTAALVHHVIDRARDYRAVQLHDERLLALGRIASGLAHELNNPASGASSAARLLEATLGRAEHAFRALAAERLSAAQLETIDAVRALCERTGPERAPLEAASREDELAEWLERHGVDLAEVGALVPSRVSVADLDSLADALPPETLGIVVAWMASTTAAHEIARDIRTATARVHDLVRAVKGFTFMDREGVPEDVDVAQGLADTVAMLESKRRAKAVEVRVEAAADLPRVHGYGSELNQVWEALIDNAIDAVDREGRVTVTATAQADAVVVQVADDGAGIPEASRARVFEPFFTTKPVGEGAGLGLHQARDAVHLHRGDIDFTSEAGRTVFRVRLPVRGARA